MGTQLNADEVFGIGVEIERNGRAFYLAAAEVAADPGLKQFFIRLADWELGHVRLFETLRARLPEAARRETVYDPAQELNLYLKAAADNHVFVRNLDAAALARACKTPREALQLAMNFEKDSVVYYAAVKRAVSAKLGQTDVDKLIDEELSHMALIDRQMRALPK